MSRSEPASEQAEERADLPAVERARDVSTDFDMAETIETPAAADWNEPPVAEGADDEFSPFPAADEVEPRRRSPIVAILIIIVIVAALAVAFYFLAPPEWKARLGVGTGAGNRAADAPCPVPRAQGRHAARPGGTQRLHAG